MFRRRDWPKISLVLLTLISIVSISVPILLAALIGYQNPPWLIGGILGTLFFALLVEHHLLRVWKQEDPYHLSGAAEFR